MKRKRGKVKIKRSTIVRIILLSLFAGMCLYALKFWNIIPDQSYTAEDFGIQTIKSETDYNKNGTDDFTDILLGARSYVQTKPAYKSAYYSGGYPPDGVGVCTDVIWKAFQNAGYSLKDLVDDDIAKNLTSYTTITKPDPNIDFRRVRNLKIFFDRTASSLTLDVSSVEKWQPGDIVVYHNHIAIVSNKRNKNGRPYIIHNAGQPNLEEDALTRQEIIGHYRWIP
ncbi:MAG: DUF1287 domain-containing protein [Anaerovorax sp.]|nr:DUF1287 domain-containing protein [Anaerovorax sp.]